MELAHMNNAATHAILPMMGSDSAMRRLNSFQLLMIDELSDMISDTYCMKPELAASVMAY